MKLWFEKGAWASKKAKNSAGQTSSESIFPNAKMFLKQ
jgi:hypothetical protein